MYVLTCTSIRYILNHLNKNMTIQINHPYGQLASIKELNSDSAVLQLNDGQKITWKKNVLPPTAKVGDVVRVIIHDSHTDAAERQRLAQAVLNHIFIN